MSIKHESITSVQDRVSSKRFGPSDFLQQQNKSFASESDVYEVLLAYANRLDGDGGRQKYHANKAARTESLLTRSGLRKLRDCRIEIRMQVEAIKREKMKRKEIPPLDRAFSVPDNPWGLIKTVQPWGGYGEDNPKYYLHMVFRYQMRLLHRACVEAGTVLEQPNLQCILDILHPSTCSSKFPPEFKRFMHECAEISVNVVSLPVPKRDNAKEVDYTTNFEAIPAVAALRRKLQKTITRWRCQDVYPEYLLNGRPGNDAITRAVALATRVRERKKKAEVVGGHVSGAIKRILTAVPQLSGISDKYASLACKTNGERLDERLGFFLRPSVRCIFVAARDKCLVEDMFDLTSRSYDHFRRFDMYCTAKSPLPFLDRDEDGNDCRKLLLMLENLASLFSLDHEVASEAVEPDQIVRDAILKLKEIGR